MSPAIARRDSRRIRGPPKKQTAGPLGGRPSLAELSAAEVLEQLATQGAEADHAQAEQRER